MDREETSYDGRPAHSVKLVILEVNSEDYEQPFVCQASNAFGQVASYIILKHRDGKIYDACVLYTKSSGSRSFYRLETFVHRILPAILEQQCGYNLFILGRDDLPGEAVVSVADEILKQSRRLMIILGSETSDCCLLEDTTEQQLAVYNALIRDGIQVILIEMDEIPDYTSMPESIRYIKQKHGAIRWKGDFSEKSCSASAQFWKNVRYQMPSRKKIPYSEVYLLPLTLNHSAAKGS